MNEMRDPEISQDAATLWMQVAESASREIGHAFLDGFVEALRERMDASMAFIALRQAPGSNRIGAIYVLEEGRPAESFTYDLDGTPCVEVFAGETVAIPCSLAERFPRDDGCDSYIGAPLTDSEGNVRGALVALSRKPIMQTEMSLALARIFGMRVETEWRREEADRARKALMEDLARRNDLLGRRYQAVRAANAFKSRLLGVIAHDLRNPLAAAMSQAELIELLAGKDAPDLEKIRSASEKAVSSADRMSALLDATLRRVSAEMSDFEIARAETDLVALARMAIEANADAAAAKSITVALEAPATLVIDADEDLLLDAIDNLVSNAVKYSHSGTAVTVTVEAADDRARLAVADQGQGLTAEDLSRVFGLFETLSAKPTAGESSTGLGLANVKEIVEAHGGAVQAQSAGRGKGAVFSLELPLQGA